METCGLKENQNDPLYEQEIEFHFMNVDSLMEEDPLDVDADKKIKRKGKETPCHDTEINGSLFRKHLIKSKDVKQTNFTVQKNLKKPEQEQVISKTSFTDLLLNQDLREQEEVFIKEEYLSSSEEEDDDDYESSDSNNGNNINHSAKSVNVEKLTFICDYCNEVFDNSLKLEVHKATHAGLNLYSCSNFDFSEDQNFMLKTYAYKRRLFQRHQIADSLNRFQGNKCRSYKRRDKKQKLSKKIDSSDHESALQAGDEYYRKFRDRNNEASRRSRMIRKFEIEERIKLADGLEERNKVLKSKALELEKSVERLRGHIMWLVLQRKKNKS